MIDFGLLTPEDKVSLLKQIYESPDFDREEAEVLQHSLDDPDAEVRLLAFKGLWHYPDPDYIPRLFAAADGDPDEDVRCQAIRTLGRYLYEGEMADYEMDWGPLEEIMREDELPQEDFLRVREFLLGVYRDPSRSLDERRFAVEALGFLFDEESVGIIEEAYAHPDRRMKISAIFAMGRNGSSRWIPILRREMDNTDPEIQREAVWAAGEMQAEELGKDLRQLTYAEDPQLQKIAVWALGQSGWEEAFARLDELSRVPDPELRAVADNALEEWLFFSEMIAQDADEDDFETMD